MYTAGLRSYNPALGRWINRDPIGEEGGVNVYGMIENNSLNDWDVLGLQEPQSKSYPYTNTIKNTTPRKLFKAGADAALEAFELTKNHPIPKNKMGYDARHRIVRHIWREPPEYCGRLCCNESSGKVTRTKPVCGGYEEQEPWYDGRIKIIEYYPKSCDPDLSPPCPEGSKEVGFYHSHPPGDTEFSDKDLLMANGRLVFVGTERGVQVAAPWQVDNYKGAYETAVRTTLVVVGDVDPETGTAKATYHKSREELYHD